MKERAPKADPKEARGPKNGPAERTTPRSKPNPDRRDDEPRGAKPPREGGPRREKPRKPGPRGDKPGAARSRGPAARSEKPRNGGPRGAKPRKLGPRGEKKPPHKGGPRHEKPRKVAPRGDRPDALRGPAPRGDSAGTARSRGPAPRGDSAGTARSRAPAPRGDKPGTTQSRGPAPRGDSARHDDRRDPKGRPAPAHDPRDRERKAGAAAAPANDRKAGAAAPAHDRKKPKPNPPRPLPAPPTGGPIRTGSVALIGRANVGKSTLLNAALGTNLAITSPTPQTTRDNLLGVLHRGNSELRILDTPGLHRPKTELGRVMNHYAREAARAADVVVFVTDLPRKGSKKRDALSPHPGDLTLLQTFKEAAAENGTLARPLVLAVNKVDQARDKGQLLPLLEAFSKVLPFDAIVPMSAVRPGDALRLFDVVATLLPEGPWQFGPDDLTDRPSRYFAAEYVREQILRATHLEVPHAAAVTIDRFVEAGDGPVEIEVTIHVERPGQKKILVGKAGEMMKQIGTRARLRLKELLDRKVVLKTWVRVTPAWRANAQHLAEMGYEKSKQDELGTMIFAELPDDDELGELDDDAATELDAPDGVEGDTVSTDEEDDDIPGDDDDATDTDEEQEQ